jgi:peptide/nickel transport system substrate-binding protein
MIIAAVLIIGGAILWYETAHKSSNTATTVTKHDIPLITFGYNNNPLNVFYPQYMVATSMGEQIFEGLVGFNNGTQIVPDLASSWTNPNATTWTFTLKPNVYYHDGDVVTAQDVVYSWQQANAQNQALASITTSTIKNVQAVNSNTVEITTTAPDAVLLNRLTSLWIIDSKAPKGTQPWELGTGPYTVKPGTTPTANNIDLVAFNKWHGGHIYTRAINYVFYADSVKATAALLAGKVNLIDNLTTANTSQISKNPNYQIYSPTTLFVDYLAFNTLSTGSPTANPKIREAIDLTIDPAAVLKAYGVTGTSVTQVIPPQLPGYKSAITRPAIDLTIAKQLVSEAGYPNGCTIVLGVGEPAATAGQEMAKELAAVGITVKLEVATSEGTYFNDINNGTYQAFYEGNGSEIADASDVLSYWQNASFYDNPTFDAQLTKADQTFDPAQRLTDLQQADQTLVSDNAYIPLFQHSYTSASNKGYVFPVYTYDNDINTFFSGVYQK